MSVRKRAWTTSKGEHKEAWIVSYRDRQGDRCQETFDRKRDADARHAAITQAIGQGTHTSRSKSITVAEAGTLWLDACEAHKLERATILGYRIFLERHIRPHLGHVRLCDLTLADVAIFEDALFKAKKSADLVRKIRVALGQLIGVAQKRGLVQRNVIRDLGRGTQRSERGAKLAAGVDIPLPSEIGAILSNAGRWRPVLVVACFTGLRASELRGLRWADVDLHAKCLTVRQRADRYNKMGPPKSKAGARVVPFGKVVLNTLREWKLSCPTKGELVFPNTKGNIETLVRIVQHGFKPAQVAAGVVTKNGKPKYSFHALRHFFASWCINTKEAGGLGLSLKEAQERLGHSSLAMTCDVYGHLFPRSEVDDLDDAELAIVSAS